ncbi:MAG: hypothetical protein ACRDNS_25130 [Trebonia sp.]
MAVLIHTLNHVPVELKLANNGCWEADSRGAQLREGDRLITRLSQLLEQPPLLSIGRWCHEGLCRTDPAQPRAGAPADGSEQKRGEDLRAFAVDGVEVR